MKYLIISTIIQLLICSCNNCQTVVAIKVENTIKIFAFEDFSYNGKKANKNICFKFTTDSEIAADKLIKLRVINDSIIDVKTYSHQDTAYFMRGNMGKFNINKHKLLNKDNMEYFIIKCYIKSWGEI